MITVEHIKAHLPSKNCQLTFMLRKKPASTPEKQSQVKLTQDYVDLDINCVIHIGQFVNCKQPVEMCVIAVTDNDKICVGSVDVDTRQSVQSKQAALQGITDQNGYLVYTLSLNQKIQNAKSLQDQTKKQSQNQKQGSDKKVSGSRGFIKYKNSSSSSSYNDNQMSFESKSGSESPFRKNKFPQHIDVSNQQYYKLLDQIYHDILEEQLKNQRAWNRIQENQIFQLRYKQRIQSLIGKNTS